MDKDEVLRKIREDKNMKLILSRAKDEAERRAIKAHAEAFAVTLYKNLFSPLAAARQEAASKVAEITPDGIVNAEASTSGSVGG